MKKLLLLPLFLTIILGGYFLLTYYEKLEKQNGDIEIGGERTAEGCLTAAGYSFNDTVGACIREWEMTPDIMEAARKAVEYVGEGYALTVVSFNSYEEKEAYDIFLERGEERIPEKVSIRDGKILPSLSLEDAEIVGFQFIQDVIAVAPPDTDPEAAARLYDSLSSAARPRVAQETIAQDIAVFVGIQDVPDQGVSVEDLQIVSDSEVYLVVGLNYSSGRPLRNIHLIVENGQWKIDRVSIPDITEQFEAEGNLVRNNPGMEAGVWYLIYEQPGAPGLSIQLQFDPSSICAESVENNTCSPEELESGQRVYVLGEYTNNDAIRVVRLEFRLR